MAHIIILCSVEKDIDRKSRSSSTAASASCTNDANCEQNPGDGCGCGGVLVVVGSARRYIWSQRGNACVENNSLVIEINCDDATMNAGIGKKNPGLWWPNRPIALSTRVLNFNGCVLSSLGCHHGSLTYPLHNSIIQIDSEVCWVPQQYSSRHWCQRQ